MSIDRYIDMKFLMSKYYDITRKSISFFPEIFLELTKSLDKLMEYSILLTIAAGLPNQLDNKT